MLLHFIITFGDSGIFARQLSFRQKFLCKDEKFFLKQL